MKLDWLPWNNVPTKPTQAQEETVIEVCDFLHITTSKEALQFALSQPALSRCMLVLGYSGWGEGQLNEEMKQGSWLGTDLGESILFDTELENRWSEAIQTLGINPMSLLSFSGFN